MLAVRRKTFKWIPFSLTRTSSQENWSSNGPWRGQAGGIGLQAERLVPGIKVDAVQTSKAIKNNRKSSKLNIIDDSPRSKVSEEDLITLPGAVQQSLPPLRKPNGTFLQNGFNDDLALTASSLLKKNGPIQEIRERPRSVDILQELLVQGILNQAHNEEWQEVHSPLMKEVKLKERLNTFNSSPLIILQDEPTRMPPLPDHAKLEEVVEKINIKQKELQQEQQEMAKEKDESNDLLDKTGLNQHERKVNAEDCCEVVELDDGHYLTTKAAEEAIVNKM
ncbi:uncharacterized protein stmnd1 isoform X3 [Heterodontus francisci]|uniref:uncharacterized protein stmnd1 isoform X3 n=1 Tax=Heterodontus francisci TaxID=7792 RepID=UPI00355BE2B4